MRTTDDSEQALPANADRETISLASNPRFLAIIERSRESHRQRGGVSLDEVRRMLGA